MTEREIHINNSRNNNHIKIDYNRDDSSDDNNMDDTFGLNLLADNNKLIQNDEKDDEIDFDFKTNPTNMDNFMNTLKNDHSSNNINSSKKSSRRGKNTLLSSESSMDGYNFKHKNTFNASLTDRHNLLLEIEKYKNKGCKFSKDYNISSNFEEMKADLDRIKAYNSNLKGVKFCRSALMTLCNGIEQLSDMTGVGELDGWGEDVNANIESYDDIFEELYQKYGYYADVLGPELKLVFLIIQSAFLYHMMRKITGSTMQNFENIINSNEKKSNGSGGITDMLSGLMGGGLGNFMGMANDIQNNNVQNNEPQIIKTPIINNNHVIKKPDYAGIETLLDDLSATSRSTTKTKNGKRVLSLT